MTGAADTKGLAARAAAETAARRSYGKLIACLAAQTRDLAEAEDALAEAFEGKADNALRFGFVTVYGDWK